MSAAHLTTDPLTRLADQAPSYRAAQRILGRGYAAQRIRARKRREETVEVAGNGGGLRPPPPPDWWSVTTVENLLFGYWWIAEVRGVVVGQGWAWSRVRAGLAADRCVDKHRD